jgi:hypothetical protein
VSASDDIRMLEAEASHYRDRVALLRAKLYRGGAVSTSRLGELERSLEGAERRLREERARRSAK